jgi:hypothetical protein
MTDMSNYLENELLDHSLGTGAAFTQPANVYALLHTGAPGEDGTANVAGNNVKSNAITFAAASGGSASSNVAADWTAVSTAETYSHVSLWDSATAGAVGNCLYQGDLTSTVTVAINDDFSIPSGSLTVSLD